MTERELLIMDSNYEALVDLLDTCDLISRLYSNGVINRRHFDFISSKSTTNEKNKALLEILSRCSLRSFDKTIICLRESNQDHIAEILETGESKHDSTVRTICIIFPMIKHVNYAYDKNTALKYVATQYCHDVAYSWRFVDNTKPRKYVRT